jgi:S-DNA-T family DNA segregation ATPase FtsK/SpoIIIE
MSDVNVGPTVSQYTLKPADGVKLNTITARSNDLALALAAPSVRIEAPIPGKSAVGVEIPNKTAAIVTLREILEADEIKKTDSSLALALGRDAAGTPFVVDLTKMPHLLIAGATGAGKSVCINSIIINLLYLNSPADLRFLLVDPKRVEFTEYNGIPHLLAPVVTDVDKTVSLLKWVVAEMERRFKLFAESSCRNIQVYNENPTEGKLPYIVVIIDELSDLMAQAANEVEASIVRIAQMARAVGIHLIVATQRPSVDVITGLIKANIPTRIAFAVASNADSRTILDQGGAEKLLGRGDMLYLSSELTQPKRAQSVLVVDKEIRSVTDFLKREGEAEYDDSITNFKPQKSHGSGGIEGNVDDALFEEAKELVIQTGKASASLLQRRLRVGYARAARLLDLLEEQGVIGPADGAKPRDILVANDQYSDGSEL